MDCSFVTRCLDMMLRLHDVVDDISELRDTVSDSAGCTSSELPEAFEWCNCATE